MACVEAFATVGVDSWHVVKVGSRLGLARVVISDRRKSPSQNPEIRAWLSEDEAQGTYMYTDLKDPEPFGDGHKWDKGVYFFTDPDTAFAFKVRFG